MKLTAAILILAATLWPTPAAATCWSACWDNWTHCRALAFSTADENQCTAERDVCLHEYCDKAEV